MKKIITIGRQYGSAGSDIGKALGEVLGIKCYDKEILFEAAKESGLCESVAEQYDEMGQSSMLYSLATTGYFGGAMNFEPINAKLFNAQFQLIRNLASKDESCIFVGRCADYILEDEVDVVKIYITADLDFRVKHVAGAYGIKESEALKKIAKRDKQRASYYNFYTSKRWADVTNYDLCINSAKTGIDGAVKLIKDYIELL